MAYELWSIDTSNLQGTYDTEAAALEVVRQLLQEHGVDYVRTLLLGFENKRGHSRLIAGGDALVKRVRDHEAARAATA